MKNVFTLTKRNCLLFLRDKATVFFSFLSSIIIISLYFLFIAKLYQQGFNDQANTILTTKQLNFAIYLQMIMGVMVINSISFAIGMFTFMAEDFEKRKMDVFMLTNVSRFEVVLSYLISGIIVSFVLNLFTFLVSFLIIGISTGLWLGAGAFFTVIGALIILTFISSAVLLLITVLIKSSSALSVLNGIVGTVIGFICGIYMPYSQLGSGMKYVASFLPFTHFTIWLKQIVLGDAFSQFGMSAEISSKMQEMWFSAGNVGFCGLNAPLWLMLILSVLFAIVCLIVSLFLIKGRKFKHGKAKIKKVKTV